MHDVDDVEADHYEEHETSKTQYLTLLIEDNLDEAFSPVNPRCESRRSLIPCDFFRELKPGFAQSGVMAGIQQGEVLYLHQESDSQSEEGMCELLSQGNELCEGGRSAQGMEEHRGQPIDGRSQTDEHGAR